MELNVFFAVTLFRQGQRPHVGERSKPLLVLPALGRVRARRHAQPELAVKRQQVLGNQLCQLLLRLGSLHSRARRWQPPSTRHNTRWNRQRSSAVQKCFQWEVAGVAAAKLAAAKLAAVNIAARHSPQRTSRRSMSWSMAATSCSVASLPPPAAAAARPRLEWCRRRCLHGCCAARHTGGCGGWHAASRTHQAPPASSKQ